MVTWVDRGRHQVKAPTCTVLLKCAKVLNNKADLSSYPHFVVEKSVQPCGFILAVVTCFADIRIILMGFKFVSIPSTLPLNRGNLMCVPKLGRPIDVPQKSLNYSLFNMKNAMMKCKDD